MWALASSSINDVHIIAYIHNTIAVDEEDMTVVTVTEASIGRDGQTEIPNRVLRADTPDGMPDRIPPRVDTPIEIKVSPGLDVGQSVKVRIEALDPNNPAFDDALAGGAIFTKYQQVGDIDITSDMVNNNETRFQIQGIVDPIFDYADQTQPGHAGRLRIYAWTVNNGLTPLTDGFSVAAIPQTMTESFYNGVYFDPDPNQPDNAWAGFAVTLDWKSDSGQNKDLDKVSIAEVLRTFWHTGSFQNYGDDEPTGYSAAFDPTLRTIDTNAVLSEGLRAPGDLITAQTHMFKDERTGARDIPMANSGYIIEFICFIDTDGYWKITTTKVGADTNATTARGDRGANEPPYPVDIDSSAGEIDPHSAHLVGDGINLTQTVGDQTEPVSPVFHT